MKIIYTPAAYSDLLALNEYITDKLHNPIAAERIISHIVKSCSNLKQMPLSGMLLSSKIQVDTDLRYLICEKYLVFYRIAENEIHIIRILDGRTNYAAQLFEK